MNSILEKTFRSSQLLPVRVLLSYLYHLIITIRNFCYDQNIFTSHRVRVPVISVGNISTGGTGKTILVQCLANHFLSSGMSPAILSRGYGRKTRGLQVVSDESTVTGSVSTSGDEPFLMATNLPNVPVIVSEDRVSGAEYLATKFSPDVIILDDAFQHRRISRDLDIVLEDKSGAVRPRLLPWGDLRESLGSTERADLVLTTKTPGSDHGEQEFKMVPSDSLFDHTGAAVSFDVVRNGFGVFSGLGNNDNFFSVVEDNIGPPTVAVPLADHCKYTDTDLARIPLAECPFWVTTQKDIIKLSPEVCTEHHILYLGVNGVLPKMLLDQLKHYFKS